MLEKIPAAGGEHAIIRQRRVGTPITVIIITALAQRNNVGDAIGKIPRRMFSRPTKAKRSEVASSKFGRAARTESLPAPKIFLQKRFSHKGHPLYGTEPFLDRFLGEGA
jgi:hypothetical protein